MMYQLLKKISTVTRMILRNEFTTYPDVVVRFEHEFAEYIGCAHGATFCNGTSSIEAALFALNVQPGDPVLVPAFTFHASISPVLNAGAHPVFVDVDPDTSNIDLADFEKKAASGAKVAIITHLWGNPVNMDEVTRIAQRYQLQIVEDASHAHGATWKGKKVGGFGAIGCFSLQGGKAVSAGEGGIAVTNDRLHWERLLLFGHFNRVLPDTAFPHHRHYGRSGLGSKRRAHPLGVALAHIELQDLDRRNKRKRRQMRALGSWLRDIPDIRLLYTEENAEPGGFMPQVPLLHIPGSARAVVTRLKKAGVPASTCPYDAWHRAPFMTDLSYRNHLIHSLQTAPESEHPPIEPIAADPCPNVAKLTEQIFFIRRDWLHRRRARGILIEAFTRL